MIWGVWNEVKHEPCQFDNVICYYQKTASNIRVLTHARVRLKTCSNIFFHRYHLFTYCLRRRKKLQQIKKFKNERFKEIDRATAENFK